MFYICLYLPDPSVTFGTGAVCLIYSNDVGLIYHSIHNTCHDQCGYHIKHGVLFDKYGRKNNGHAQHKGAGVYFFILSKLWIVDNSQVRTDGIIHMDAWPKVCRRVYAVQVRYKSGENIVSWHCIGPEMMSVGPESGDHQEYGHPGKKKYAGIVIFLFAVKKAIQNCR